jgi:hypothetical protein
MNTKRHLIFSDESGYDGDNRYGCLAKISGTFEATKELNSIVKAHLGEISKDELKFAKIKSQNHIALAKSYLDASIKMIASGAIKLHVLLWDKHDSRHDIKGRDDMENLKRMYYHNLKQLQKHWNLDTNWEFYPDEFSAINWKEEIVPFIENTNLRKVPHGQSKLFDHLDSSLYSTFSKVREADSKELPIIQVADLYAGLIRTSRQESKYFQHWLSTHSVKEQLSLFQSEQKISNSLIPKFQVMKYFKEEASRYSLGVNFSENKYFQTFGKQTNISIWHYKPQGDYDKAPVK